MSFLSPYLSFSSSLLPSNHRPINHSAEALYTYRLTAMSASTAASHPDKAHISGGNGATAPARE
jgi:hypothetical protein